MSDSAAAVSMGSGEAGSRPALFSLRATVVIALLLGVPFVVRTLTDLQPYPALLFPAGAVEIPVVNDRALFGYFLVYAKTPQGLTPIHPGDLIRPLPPYFFYDLATRTLVLRAPPTQEVMVKRLRSFSVPRYVPSAAEQREVVQWWARRVRELCPGATQLVIRSQAAQFDVVQHRLAMSRTDDEIVIQFP